MADMKRTWDALKGWEIDGLTIMYHKLGPSYTINCGHHTEEVYFPGKPAVHRAALMLVVDALEAAGEAYFERRLSGKQLVWSAGCASTQEVEAESAKQHGGDEALTLGALLERVREAMGG